MSELASIRPTQLQHVIDLVRDAEVDVSDWANFAGGPARAASNPKYCYEWSFIEPGKVVVVNLWHDDMRERDGRVVLEANMRQSARVHGQPGGKDVWRKRAENLDRAIRTAAQEQLPIRAIICEGRKRQRDDITARASKVRARSLDPMPWAVTEYDDITGQFTLTRGAIQARLVDQFSLEDDPDTPTERRTTSGHVYVRSREVRRRALARADGKCEFCNQRGFAIAGGGVFLETHHVIPLSEGGPDTLRNVAALCPNHHREAHHGEMQHTICTLLLAKLQKQA